MAASHVWLVAVGTTLLVAFVTSSSVNQTQGFDVMVRDGQYTVTLDGQPWLVGGAAKVWFNQSLALGLQSSPVTIGHDRFGNYTLTTLVYAPVAPPPPQSLGVSVHLSIRVYHDREMAVFSQYWPNGTDPFEKLAVEAQNRQRELQLAQGSCGHVLNGTDQEGGSILAFLTGMSEAQCCDACVKNKYCTVWVREPQNNLCWLIDHPKGAYFNQDRVSGWFQPPPVDPQTTSLMGFPSFDVSAPRHAGPPLKYLVWGGCQIAAPTYGDWTAGSIGWQGNTDGIPLVLYSPSGRTLVMSPLTNFFGAIQPVSVQGHLQGGIKSTITRFPPGFVHDTVVAAGTSINSTMYAWGDVLLALSGKARTRLYDDYVLGHLGYWTDNGAYYYHDKGQFDTAQETLLAVKSSLELQKLPVKYFQFDDWWFFSQGDVPGLQYWWPRPGEFPSGLTDWLHSNTSLYAPMYDANSVYADVPRYNWTVDTVYHSSALPLSEQFYLELFANGSRANMRMFEQDFLCTINTESGLTNRDLTSGMTWFKVMDAAAMEAGVSLQFCMMNPIHALASTHVHTMTNGRATPDNCRGDASNVLPMGINGLLYGALGFFASRDNVWTSGPQPGCNRYCEQPNAVVDNAVALLSGGPYGISDAIGHTNASLVMRAARADGVLLRPRQQLSVLDAGLLAQPRAELWAAFDYMSVSSSSEVASSTVGPPPSAPATTAAWWYFMALSLNNTMVLKASDLSAPTVPDSAAYVRWDPLCSRHQLTTGNCSMDMFTPDRPWMVPACPNPTHAKTGFVYQHFAPLLPNSSWVLLGELNKWSSVSYRRFTSVSVMDGGLSVQFVGVSKEVVSIVVGHVPGGAAPLPTAPAAVKVVDCKLPVDCAGECSAALLCNAAACKCIV